MSYRIVTISIILFLVIIPMNSGWCQDSKLPSSQLQLKYGYFSDGQITVKGDIGSAFTWHLTEDKERKYPTQRSYIAGVAMDVRTISMLYVGLSCDVANINYYDNIEELLLVIGLNFKGKFHLGENGFSVSPGFGFGYGFLNDFLFLDRSRYLTFTHRNEFAYSISNSIEFIGELSLFWGLAGGDGKFDVTGGPFLILRGGLGFNPP